MAAIAEAEMKASAVVMTAVLRPQHIDIPEQLTTYVLDSTSSTCGQSVSQSTTAGEVTAQYQIIQSTEFIDGGCAGWFRKKDKFREIIGPRTFRIGCGLKTVNESSLVHTTCDYRCMPCVELKVKRMARREAERKFGIEAKSSRYVMF